MTTKERTAHDVADLTLADAGARRIEWAAREMPVLARIRAACARLLAALGRPADLLDTALADGQAPGVVADRIAAAVVPDADLRQALLETLEVDRRLARLADALDALVRELSGGRG